MRIHSHGDLVAAAGLGGRGNASHQVLALVGQVQIDLSAHHTILCLDGTEVIGACMASELTRDGYVNMNAHQTIYVVTPEHTTGSQLLFRENTSPMIAGKHVLILAASVTTGYTAQAAVEAINYYGGQVVGIGAIFATQTECAGYPVTSIFNPNDLGDYQSYDSRDCPWCKQGKRIDALVNSFGYSSL